MKEVMAIFGPDAQALVDTSDPVIARRNQQVFTVAVSEGWRLEEAADKATLVVGHEEWPFPIPLVKDGAEWRFDAAAGKEEILARRIGRNELAAIKLCRAYVTAQRLYAKYRTRRETGRPLRASVPERPGPAGWPLLAGPPWRPEEPARRPLRGRVDRSEGGAPRHWRATPLPRLLLPHPHRTRPGGHRRGARLRRERRVERRLRAGRVAVAVRRHRRHDVHRQPGRHRLGSRPGARHRRGGARAARVRPRFEMDGDSVTAAVCHLHLKARRHATERKKERRGGTSRQLRGSPLAVVGAVSQRTPVGHRARRLQRLG